MDLMDKLELDHLEGEQRQLATVVGIEAYRELIRHYAGLAVYIPTKDKVLIPVRDALIRDEFTGYNARELAQKYELTEQWIRCIVADVAKEIRRQPVKGQVSMFD